MNSSKDFIFNFNQLISIKCIEHSLDLAMFPKINKDLSLVLHFQMSSYEQIQKYSFKIFITSNTPLPI